MQWLLIDGNSWFARDWYAAQADAHRAFLRRLETMCKQFSFYRVAVAWDAKNSFRKEIAPEYKTHRGGKPDGFEACLTIMKQAVADAGIDGLEVSGFEGDDVLASLVQVALDEGARAVVCSSDADLHQLLVTGQVSQVTNWKRSTADELSLSTMTFDRFFETYGVRPWQWVDYRVIVGDASDGIRGVDGLGKKAARDVIATCGTLDAFFVSPFRARSLTARQRNTLLAFRDQVERSRQLLTLRRDVPLPARWFQSLVSEGAA